MTNYTDYTAYFEQLAADFCNHSEAEKHFFRKGLEEFLNGMQTSVNYPAMLLGRYDFVYEEHGADNYMKARTVAFIVCDHVHDSEDYNSIDSAVDNCERIVDLIFNRILVDIAEPRHAFLKQVKIGNIQVSPIDNYADSNYGYFVTIQILTHHNTVV